MKLVVAIVHDEDAHRVTDELLKNKFSVTKLASTGGFLKSGNTTLIIGVQKEKVDDVIEIIRKLCKSRKHITSSTPMSSWSIGAYISYPVEIQIGGATVFVLDVEKFIKV